MMSPEDAFDESRFQRARRYRIDEQHEPIFASPEDVIIHKLVFHRQSGSEKHLRDITGILKVIGSSLDHEYIRRRITHFQLQGNWTAVRGRAGS